MGAAIGRSVILQEIPEMEGEFTGENSGHPRMLLFLQAVIPKRGTLDGELPSVRIYQIM
jgi:hypothetical protein